MRFDAKSSMGDFINQSFIGNTTTTTSTTTLVQPMISEQMKRGIVSLTGGVRDVPPSSLLMWGL